jgi:4-hydroxybenzoate polyprenyltransferase
LTRPILLVPVWAFLLLGYFRAGGNRFQIDRGFLLVLVSYSLLMVALYVINQIIDMKSDAINRKHLILAEGLMPVRNALLFLIVLLIGSSVIAIRLPALTRIFMAVSLMLGIFYSLPPFVLKARPFVDFLVNGVGYGFFNFAMGWLSLKPFSRQTLIYSLPYVFAVSAIFVNTTILDIEGDRKCRYLTSGVLLGERGAALLGLTLIAACAGLSVYARDYFCLAPALIALPLFFLAAFKKSVKFVTLSIRIGGPLLILVAGLLFPYFLVLCLLVLIFLRVYYKKVFGIVYPSL